MAHKIAVIGGDGIGPEVTAEATAFLRQEAQHSSTHRKHVAGLIKAYPGLQKTFDQVRTDEPGAAYDEDLHSCGPAR